MPKIKKSPNLKELAYRSIKKDILTGSFGEAGRLTEDLLALQLGISKSPIREALNRLEAEGLIIIEPRRGACIRQFSSKEVSELYDLREVLEDHAVKTAIITPKLLNELCLSVQRTTNLIKDGNKLGNMEEDLRFHGAIMSATGNTELCKVLKNLQQKSLLCRMKSIEIATYTTPAPHMKIYEALKDGNKSQARAAMREHIAFVREQLLTSIKRA